MSASESDPNDLFEGYFQEETSDLFQITHEQYAADRDATTRGIANPSVMNKPFRLFQVGPGGVPAWQARTTFGDTREDSEDWDQPVWCFIRYGATRTKIPDGRIVCIGGEHEDSYDPDFYIYNGTSSLRAVDNQTSKMRASILLPDSSCCIIQQAHHRLNGPGRRGRHRRTAEKRSTSTAHSRIHHNIRVSLVVTISPPTHITLIAYLNMLTPSQLSNLHFPPNRLPHLHLHRRPNNRKRIHNHHRRTRLHRPSLA